MLFIKHALLTLVLTAVIGLFVAAWIIVGGRFDVSVAAQLPQPIHDLIHQTRVNAVRREARGLQAPAVDLDDEVLLRSAALRFQTLCADCHHPPGGQPASLAQSLNPIPANLTEAARKRSLEELFWVTKHGIRMSAMPAWGNHHGDEALWTLAAFIQRFPAMTAVDYQNLLDQAELTPAVDGEDAQHIEIEPASPTQPQ
ncbi:MAG: c-type cytochrome [Wenzhouxiangella sp.]